MGTETLHSSNSSNIPGRLKKVKLNDPLMGTETMMSHSKWLLKNGISVKLNDPLMGTETSK